MPRTLKVDTSARKSPVQARAQVTVDAMLEATIQVLLAEGLGRLTTIRVAARAGTSVGTLYQYFPNKQALLFAVLTRHVSRIGEQVALAAERVQHQPLAVIVTALVDAFVEAKTSRMDEARALYWASAEVDSRAIIAASQERGMAMLIATLGTASDVTFEDLPTVAYMFMASMIGSTMFMIEGGAPPSVVRAWRGQMRALCLGYLTTVANFTRDADELSGIA